MGIPIKIEIENDILYLELYQNGSCIRMGDYKYIIDQYGEDFKKYPLNGKIYKECFKIDKF